MYITYHESVALKGDECLIPFDILREEVREWISEQVGDVQKEYLCRTNGFYFFIHLSNGDRIDVKL
jgi:hypothetical protein